MRAAYVDRLGPAESIRYGELPAPVPKADDVLVEVIATVVDPVDLLVRSGAFSTETPLPFVVGRDLVGRVHETGNGLEIGDLVWCNSMGHDGRQGAAAELVAVPVERLYRLPAGVDPIAAVAVLHPAATAHLALFTQGRLAAGETVYVAGGAGHVGRAAITMAVLSSARVVASASADGLESCLGRGAKVALDYHDADFTEALRDAVTDGIDVHLDTSGRADIAAAVDLMRIGGRIIVIAGDEREQTLVTSRLYTKNVSIRGFVISHATPAQLTEAAEHMNRLLAQGALVPSALEVLPVSEMATAHRRLETGDARGLRLVLVP